MVKHNSKIQLRQKIKNWEVVINSLHYDVLHWKRSYRLTTIYIRDTQGYQDTQEVKSLRQGKPVVTSFSCQSVTMDAMNVPMAVFLALLLVAPSTAYDGQHHHAPSPDHHHNADAPSPHHNHHHHHHAKMPTPVGSDLLTHALGPHHHGSQHHRLMSEKGLHHHGRHHAPAPIHHHHHHYAPASPLINHHHHHHGHNLAPAMTHHSP
jgi:hypothetical protein